MMRDVEEMNTIETAQALDLTEENVKTRLCRAHKLLRRAFYLQANAGRKEAFAFLGASCDRLSRTYLRGSNGFKFENEMPASLGPQIE
jgi:RNA polymerase sigma-70 factor, ECF subfamily